MKLVLDASAAIRLAASDLGEMPRNVEQILVPDLFVSEIANTVWKYHAFGNMSYEQCEVLMERALRMPDVVVSASLLYREAFRQACSLKLPVYDLFYLALARRENARLFTRDKKLIGLAHRQGVQTV